MNQQETVRLFSQGRDAWNAWAEERLAERQAFEKEGEDLSEPWTLGEDAEAWLEAAKVDFSGYSFDEDAAFQGFHFPGDVDFGEAAFSGDAVFGEAAFSGYANFGEAAFSGDADFREAAFSGDADFEKAAFSGYANFEKAAFSGYANFGEAAFSGGADFEKAAFSGVAVFREATFSGAADFREAAFSGDADFEKAAFSGYANFEKAAFSGYANFGEAAFSGGAYFWKAAFSGNADFEKAAFSGGADFNSAEFEGATDFTAIKAHSIFSMVGTRFRLVPELAHADFKPEAPRLDTLRIEPRGFWKQTLRLVKGDSKGNPEGPGRWRVLQKLANDGHDHISEQRFFRGELLAKRGSEEQWWRASFTFFISLIYQVTSNFGASLILPLLWWGTGIVGSAWFYLTEHMVRVANPEASMASATSRIWRRLWEGGEGFACIAGEGQPVFAAIGLSMSKSLFAGFGPARTLDQIHACLYGIHVRSTFESFQPVIPGWVTGIGVVQFLASAILIVLFGLALRNHFKIK